MIITQTPFRMSFFGGGTDMENFFKEHGGAVLSTTFDKYCYVNVRHLPRFFDYSTELSYSKTERVTDINDIQHPAIRNAMKMLDMHEIRLTYEADLPARSGLGTSSSFAVGMLNAFYALKGKYYLYLEDDRLYKIERVTDSLIYLKDMERPAWAARVLRPNQYDAELAKNPLNDYLLAGQESALKDSRCVYKECLYSMLDAVQQSEIYPYLRDRDVDADEAEKELRNKIDELLEQNAKTAPLYLEASQNWENFKDWLVEDIFQRTYQDVITDRRDAVALYQDSKDAPQWVRGIMVPYAAEEKAVEPTLQPLPLDAVNEYNALKERYPDALVGYEQYGNFEFYGEDAKRVSELLGSKLLEKETALGKVEVSGFPREQWASQAMKLWKQGESVYLSGQQEDGTHAQTKYFRREEYLPVNTIIELDDREFRVDSVNFEQGTVSLQDMTLAKEARYPIFRTEPLEYIRHLYEQADVPMKEAIETTVFTALHNAGVAYEDFSPEQMDVIYSVAESGGELEELLNPDFSPEQMQLIADVQTRTDAIHRSAADDAVKPLTSKPMTPEEVNHARRQHNLPLDSGAETEQPVQPKQEPMNFRITDDDLGAGGAKTKFKANIEAIRLLQTLDAEQRQATAEEQEVLSRYVGWGGIPQAFDEKNTDWAKEYAELKSLLPADEYSEARASTLNAFYTSPTVIKAMYEALSNMGLSKGNVLEPSCGVGNFMGLVPESMENIKMYGVELDNVSGRIAQQLYQKNKIAVQGFETMQFPDSFFDCVVGNVPFGNYKVPDKRYDRHNFLIHDYFIAKSLDLVRPGGVVAVVTSSGTMDKKDSSVREYSGRIAAIVCWHLLRFWTRIKTSSGWQIFSRNALFASRNPSPLWILRVKPWHSPLEKKQRSMCRLWQNFAERQSRK